MTPEELDQLDALCSAAPIEQIAQSELAKLCSFDFKHKRNLVTPNKGVSPQMADQALDMDFSSIPNTLTATTNRPVRSR